MKRMSHVLQITVVTRNQKGILLWIQEVEQASEKLIKFLEKRVRGVFDSAVAHLVGEEVLKEGKGMRAMHVREVGGSFCNGAAVDLEMQPLSPRVRCKICGHCLASPKGVEIPKGDVRCRAAPSSHSLSSTRMLEKLRREGICKGSGTRCGREETLNLVE